jgi:integrase
LQRQHTFLIDRVSGESERTVADWIDRYRQILSERKLAPATQDAFRQRLKTIEDKLGKLIVARVSTRDIADFILEWDGAGKKRMAQALRSFLLDMFREAVAAGWIETNPVAVTRAPRVEVTRARLTLDDFLAIYEQATTFSPRVCRSMELALVTDQRREDIRTLSFRDVREGRLWIEQEKTGSKVCIPLELRLDAVGLTVGDVVTACREGALSRWLVHHSVSMGRAKAGGKVRDTTISQAFAEARDGAGVAVAGKTPPTFHELRSLSLRLYHDQGINAQALAGHKSADMTSVYRDVRGDEWVKVRG